MRIDALYVRLSWSIAAALAVQTLVGTALAAQTIIKPAPPTDIVKPVWNCRFQQPVGSTKIYASRLLDEKGARLSDSASWTDADTANRNALLTISVNWSSDDSRWPFAEGSASLYFRAKKTLPRPLALRLGNPEGEKIAAGQAYIDPQTFQANARIGKVLAAITNDATLAWKLAGGTGDTQTARDSLVGSYAAADLQALTLAFPQTIAGLNAMQADFANRCIRMR